MKITRGSSSLSTTVYLTNDANDDADVFWPWAEQYVKIYLIEHRRIPVKVVVFLFRVVKLTGEDKVNNHGYDKFDRALGQIDHYFTSSGKNEK